MLRAIHITLCVLAMTYCAFVGIACLVGLYATFGPFWFSFGAIGAIAASIIIRIFRVDYLSTFLPELDDA